MGRYVEFNEFAVVPRLMLTGQPSIEAGQSLIEAVPEATELLERVIYGGVDWRILCKLCNTFSSLMLTTLHGS